MHATFPAQCFELVTLIIFVVHGLCVLGVGCVGAEGASFSCYLRQYKRQSKYTTHEGQNLNF